MDVEWGVRVTKLARVTLLDHIYNRKKDMPVPPDIKILSMYLDEEIAKLGLDDMSQVNSRQVIKLAEAKLILYNRRRSGEARAIG